MAISDVFSWSKARRAAQGATNRGQMERYPTHTRVVLPDGAIMLVRVASLASAKDLLAAQRAAERKIAARVLGEARQAIEDVTHDGVR
ncbi:MAG TPA: hypothetical protein VF808_11140 [Ktedonobacterales bacterium]